MGRSKVPIKLIECPKARHNTFLKRSKGLKKKAFEFATLCDVDVLMICLEPQGGRQLEYMTWPDEPVEIRRIVKRYEGLSKEEQDRRKLDLPGFLEERIKKLEDELARKGKERAETMYPSWDDELNNLTEQELRNLLGELDSKLETLNEKIESLKCNKHNSRGKEVYATEITPQVYLNHMHEMSTMMYEKNTTRDLDLVAARPIDEPVPISYMKPPDQFYMPIQLPNYYPNFSDFHNLNTSYDSLLLPPVNGCYGNPAVDHNLLLPPAKGFYENQGIHKLLLPTHVKGSCYGNPGIGMMENDNLPNLPLVKGCYNNNNADVGFGMLDNTDHSMVHFQPDQSCVDGCLCSLLQFQSSAMEPTSSSNLNLQRQYYN